MKILQVINNLDIGGAEALLRDYVLHSARNENIVVTLVKNDSLITKALEEKGVKVIDLDLVNKYRVLSALRGIRRAIREEKPDIVHGHLFPPQYYLAVLKPFFRRVPFLFTEHSTSNKRREKKLFLPLEKWSYGAFDKVISIGEVTKAELEKIHQSPKNVVVYGGIDSTRYMKERKISYDFILVGSLRGNEKGVYIFLNALAMMKDSFQKAVILGDGVLRGELTAMRDSLGLTGSVDFLGNVPNVEDYLSQAKIFVLPSRFEGLPISIMEAMFAKTPIIASRVGGIPEIVPDRDCAYLFPVGDATALKEAMQKLLTDQPLRESLAENAFERAAGTFTLEAYTRRMDDLYDEVVK
ncbi:MAG TPA: glycosyltransferase [Clostridiaceae bacterium]|nr:glycosyltransferase [Clostridiaceae bacterium]